MNTLLNSLYKGENVRTILSQLRLAIRDKDNFGIIYDKVCDDSSFFLSFLSHADAKTRKNAALLLGELGMEDFLQELWDAYESETQLFVKSAYLTALSHLDYDSLLPKFHERYDVLSSTTLTSDIRKHIEEEMRILSQMMIASEGINTHIFKGYLNEHDCVLLTNRNYKEITEKQLADEDLIPFHAGVRVKTTKLKKLLEIRTYSELLFVIDGMEVCQADPLMAARKIADSSLIETLKKDHKGMLPFYFRLEIRNRQPLDKRALFAKRLASAIESATNHVLLNSPHDYEFEIRLIENKNGNYHALVKYMTIPDVRFDYRQEHVASSIKPSGAALLVELAKDYMAKDAQVLDPFCGVATMLIERQKVVKANTSYGIDTSAEAIEKAKQNMENAGQIIHFVNRNFFTFTHEHLFDEIFTNMPWATGKVTKNEIHDLYSRFFKHAKTLLSPGATIILYTHDADLARHFGLQSGYTIKKSYPISEKDGTALIIFQ